MKTIGIIQARIGSTRLPGKVLLDLEGRTVLERVCERVIASRLIDDVVVATTISNKDLAIVKLCADLGISVYCGSEEDVLDRYYQAARLFGANFVVRITSDCPMIDPGVIDALISHHRNEKADYSSNGIKETYPDGQDVEMFTFNALSKAWSNANLLSEREHVTPYIRKHTEMFKVVNLEYHEDMSKKRWTLDEPEDYEFIKIVYKHLYKENNLFGMKEILDFVNRNPQIENINHHITRNEGYLKSLQKDAFVNPGSGQE